MKTLAEQIRSASGLNLRTSAVDCDTDVTRLYRKRTLIQYAETVQTITNLPPPDWGRGHVGKRAPLLDKRAPLVAKGLKSFK